MTNDFFELPVGDQYHKECIEIEHSDDYLKGFDDGIESFRPKFEDIINQINTPKTCNTCIWKGVVETFEQLYCNEILAFVPKKFGCILHKIEEDS